MNRKGGSVELTYVHVCICLSTVIMYNSKKTIIILFGAIEIILYVLKVIVPLLEGFGYMNLSRPLEPSFMVLLYLLLVDHTY